MASREPVVTVDESSKRALWMTMLRIPNRWFSTGMILTQGVYIYIYYMFFLLRGVEDERMQEDPGFGEKFQMNETLNILVRHLLLVAMHLFQWQDSEFM